MSVDRRRFIGSAAALAAAPLVTGCSGYEKIPVAGAATTCFVAASPLLESTRGRYFEDCNAIEVPDSHLQDMAMADRLWLASEELTRDYLFTRESRELGRLGNMLRETGRVGS